MGKFKNPLFIFAIFMLVIYATAASTSCGDDTLEKSEEASALKVSQVGKFDSGAAINTVVNASNQFAFDLYSVLKGEEGNIFFSPYSLSLAMAMAYEGARGQTAEEIKQVFYYPEDIEILRRGYAETINQINKKDKKYELRTANALWAQNNYPFLPEYFKTVEKYYGGKVTNVDFVRDTENSRLTINKWVEGQTNNRIKDLLPQEVITPLTRLVLTNAIYFKGNWENQFPKGNTKEEEFWISADKKVRVPLMFIRERKFNYTENENLQLLELPYAGNELSMLVLLPRNELREVEPYLKPDKIQDLMKDMRQEELDVYLPRFKFETKYLMGGEQGLLGRMGMPTAFSEMRADFSGMTGKPDLCITEVVHQAFVEVNEEGTEAAAATGIVMGIKAMLEKKVFRADHPFIFFILEKRTGAILFFGRVIDPAK
ncbi:MAG: serpin family protein [Candidatus Aminicenantes bacterium]|nr:serpin family protein [Candidatus Aminicenantes bacterium]